MDLDFQVIDETGLEDEAVTGTRKRVVTIRLDSDVVAWLKSAGPGYQTRINRLLREEMERRMRAARE